MSTVPLRIIMHPALSYASPSTMDKFKFDTDLDNNDHLEAALSRDRHTLGRGLTPTTPHTPGGLGAYSLPNPDSTNSTHADRLLDNDGPSYQPRSSNTDSRLGEDSPSNHHQSRSQAFPIR